MSTLDELRENFRFMVSAVVSQVEQTLKFLQAPSHRGMDKITSGDDYIDTLKSLIEEKTFQLLMTPQGMSKQQAALLRSMNTITSNLERMADFAVNIPRQMNHLSEPSFVTSFGFEKLFKEVLSGLSHIVRAVERRDAGLAFRICQCEFNLDSLHQECFATVLKDLRAGGEPGDLVTVLFISNYLERMGDSLLNIGEAILFSVVGEKMKIHQYRALTDGLGSQGEKPPISQVEFESIWGTRSGCRIGVTRKQSEDAARPVLFKHGNLAKLTSEKENTELWDQIIPGLPPKIWEFQPDGEGNGSVLMEYLTGCTLQDMVLNAQEEELGNALFLLEETLGQAWTVTRREGEITADFLGQLKRRQEAVFRMHPEFDTGQLGIGDLPLHSFGSLLGMVEKATEGLRAPFSVLIHGDLNLNNIIYSGDGERIHFIDLHRSKYTDYVQDISVFVVSNFRLPVFQRELRSRVDASIEAFLRFAGKFARVTGDDTFEARLTMGLARSLFSSTRFEMNRRFSREMFLRSVYLLEKLKDHQGRPWSEFRCPVKALVY
ncbi:MAG: phosphotransferase [Desulfarculaceae bacterium]|nr:phosphotransferase [Desulfarculaceae bacterium]MCF8071538.1 phosphotransferase [Desulfarculaceae bacterium]MCF8102353.1 phosphotransferase [Desulfarculaceae bacterium]MCF8114817.1 phosphotransferase [Desulfarculaceae bacterium]